MSADDEPLNPTRPPIRALGSGRHPIPDLARAAEIVRMRPTALARLLGMRGVDQILGGTRSGG